MASSQPQFRFYVDWDNNGDFSGPGEDVTARVMSSAGLSVSYGRDQARALSPVQPGQASFTLNNTSRDYYPDNAASPLAGKVTTGKPVFMTAQQDATIYTLYRGFIDDFTLAPNRPGRTLAVSCLDLLARFSQVKLSTGLLDAPRTGTVIGTILDQIGWPSGARDLDPGGTSYRWWWSEGDDALTALGQVLASEGPPALCFVDAATGNFVFRDRHHRLLRAASTTAQCTFTNGGTAETGTSIAYSMPASYDAGWRDVVNLVQVSVDQRGTDGNLAAVWSTQDTIAILAGQSATVIAQASDPFYGAVAPVSGTDYTTLTGTVTATLDRTSGQAAQITLTDTGAGSVLAGLQLRAVPVPVQRTTKITVTDPASQAAFGVRGLPSGISLGDAQAEDVTAVAEIYVARYAQRRPVMTVPVTNANANRLAHQLTRDLSDRIHITDSETGTDADFFIEQIRHDASEGGRVLTTTFGCEQAPQSTASPFTFDDATLGKFDTGGQFASTYTDDPATVFVFDDATRGKFGTGVFGT